MNVKNMSAQGSDNSERLTLEELKYIRSEYKNKAEFWANRIVKYLEENSQLFPELDTNTGSEMEPDKLGYECPIYIRKENR